jgi:hypothetical protein
MTSDNDYEFVYEGSNESFVKGSDPDFCIESLQIDSPIGDTFVLSPDKTTISHLREGVAIDVLRRVKPL